MPKSNPLTEALKQIAPPRSAKKRAKVTKGMVEKPQDQSSKTSAARIGRVLVGGHFPPEVQTALKIIAAQERTTMQALLAEAINTVFAKRQKPEIADISVS